MRIYFDSCCVNRLTDDQSQQRILREAEAIEELIGFSTTESNTWVGSAVLEAEIARNPDCDRREDAEALLAFVKQVVKLDDEIVRRARELQSAGLSEFDALHLACAESARVDIFLTTDDRLVHKANRQPDNLAIRVLNPVSFLQEVKNANPRND
jgi:predicted nucleic acid-binding protein